MTVVYRWSHAPAPSNDKRSHLSSPNFVRDELGGLHGLQSMSDGKQYDSKSKYYRSLKDQGAHIVEHKDPKGFIPHKSKGSAPDIKKALQQLKAR